MRMDLQEHHQVKMSTHQMLTWLAAHELTPPFPADVSFLTCRQQFFLLISSLTDDQGL